MWNDLSEEARAFRAHCRKFADEVMAPAYATYDRENRFPDGIHEQARAWNLFHRDFPEALGGGGLSDVAAAAGAEALASVCAPCAFSIGFNRGALHPVLRAGTPDQQARLVGRMIAEQRYAALCLTEPEVSGSNLLGLATTARRTDRGWVIDGTKCMVGNGGVASLFLVLAQTEVDGRQRGLTFFAVPRGEGVDVGPNTDKLGFRAVETPTISFSAVEVSDQDRIGEVGSGDALMFDTLNAIRVGGAAVILGIVVGALSDALPWLEQRQVFGGGVLIQKSHVQMALGDIYGRLQSTRAMVLRGARLRQAGQSYGHEAAIAKLHASKLAVDATSQISQMFGWRGIDGDYAIQKRFRDARQTTIFEGTSELQKLNLFREMVRRWHSEGVI